MIVAYVGYVKIVLTYRADHAICPDVRHNKNEQEWFKRGIVDKDAMIDLVNHSSRIHVCGCLCCSKGHSI